MALYFPKLCYYPYRDMFGPHSILLRVSILVVYRSYFVLEI